MQNNKCFIRGAGDHREAAVIQIKGLRARPGRRQIVW